jgi:predicted nucleic acid-binding protein
VYVVDASVWVSWFLTDDVFHAESRGWIDLAKASAALLVAPALLLPELAGSIARRTGDSVLGRDVALHLERLPSTQFVPLEADLARLAAGLAAELRIKGADAVYVSVALSAGLPLVTWDAEQRDRGRAVAQVLSPAELLDRGSKS